MIKILYIHHNSSWGGSPNSLFKMINHIDRSKFSVEVLLLKNSIIADKLAENGIKFHIAQSIFYNRYYRFFPHSEAGYVKWYQIFMFLKHSILWLLSRYVFSGKELNRLRFDIVHLNSTFLTDWIYTAKRKAKVVVHIREPFRKGNFDVLHFFFRSIINKYADQIIAISQDNARRINIPGKTKVIYNFTDNDLSNISEDSYASKKVLYLGGSGTSKGFYTLVEALSYLNSNTKVIFGGHYAESSFSSNLFSIMKYFLSNARKRNIAIKIIKTHPCSEFVGHIDDVHKYLNEVCCLVSPFVVPHFSRPVMEAHLSKKPAIGSDVEGMDEIIQHDKDGLIVSKNDPKALALAINLLANDPKKAKMFGETGYKNSIYKFSIKNVKQLERVYEKL